MTRELDMFSAAPAGRGELFSAGAARRIHRGSAANPRRSRGREPYPAGGRPRTVKRGRERCSINLQYRQECLLRNLDGAHLLHPLLALLLFLEELALARDVAAIA